MSCGISTLLSTGTTWDKRKVGISQNFVAFSEYVNFNYCILAVGSYTKCAELQATFHSMNHFWRGVKNCGSKIHFVVYKGQIISKRLFCVFNFLQKGTKTSQP